MASRGVNGAAAASLNERFIKCEGCRVNVPKEDMLALGKCTVCGRAYTPGASGENTVVVETVAFAGDLTPASAASTTTATAVLSATVKAKRKRWVELKSKRGRTYYHNTDTGEDTWEKPVDIDAEAIGNDGFVPFKNDAVKNAVLREQAKMDATKMGLPAEVIATLQQQQLEEQQQADAQDPLNSMLNRPAQNAKAPAPTTTTSPAPYQPRLEGIEDADRDHDDDDDNEQETDRRSSTGDASPAKQSSCAVMEQESKTDIFSVAQETHTLPLAPLSALVPPTMKPTLLSLLVMIGVVFASLCAADGPCPEDAMLCGTQAIGRDSENNCEFFPCNITTEPTPANTPTPAQLKSFTLSKVHV